MTRLTKREVKAVLKAAVSERPILFSAPMVRAILAGRKTQTRRIVKQPMSFVGGRGDENDLRCYETKYGDYRDPEEALTWDRLLSHFPNLYPFGEIGDRLWVRETFNTDWCDKTIYRADGGSAVAAGYAAEPKWKPSIFMPRSASRIILEITNVRVERLNQITRNDAMLEGVDSFTKDGSVIKWSAETDPRNWQDMPRTPEIAFKELWNSINGEDVWAKNPWVWVIEFKRLENP